MPVDAPTLRTQLQNRLTNDNPTVAGGGKTVTLALQFDRQFVPEDLHDALGAKYGVAAALTTALAGANNDLTFTARTPGGNGNLITVRYVVAGNNTALSVSVAGNAITVNVATDGGGAATSTGDQIRDAINKDAAASALVRAERAAANDGTGAVIALAATALSGGDSKVTGEGDSAAAGRYRWRIKA
jgi:hypothetical protein